MRNTNTSAKSSWFRFRLWHVLALVTLVAIPIGVYAELERRFARQEAAIAVVNQFGGDVEIELVGPEWLPERYRERVVGVRCDDFTYSHGALYFTREAFEVDPDIQTEYALPHDDPFAPQPGTVDDPFAPAASDDPFDIPPGADPFAPTTEDPTPKKVLNRPSARAFFAALATFRGLRELRLSSAGVRDVHVAMFNPDWPLTTLDLSGSELTKVGFAKLTQYADLQTLNLRRAHVDIAMLNQLPAFKCLETLDLADTSVSDAGLAPIGRTTSLQWLDLTSTEVKGAGLASLAGLVNLESLTLSGPTIPPDESGDIVKIFDHLRSSEPHLLSAGELPILPSLRSLRFPSTFHIRHGTVLSEDAFKAIGEQPELKELSLLQCQFEEDWLRHLSNLSLEEVQIQGSPISMKGLRNVANVESIKFISLDQGQGVSPDELAEFITQAEQLETLYLEGVLRSDALIDAVCDSPNLTRFELKGAALTPRDVSRINAHPDRHSITPRGTLDWTPQCFVQ